MLPLSRIYRLVRAFFKAPVGRVFVEPLEARALLSTPEVAWGSYLGKGANDYANDVTHDAEGNVYVVGTMTSAGWAAGGYDTTFAGGVNAYHGTDAYAIKFSGEGEFLWSTYLGGTGDEQGNSIGVDGAGNVYVTGFTSSDDWISGGFDTSYNNTWDGFLVKLSSAGQHVWSTYLDGEGSGVAVDDAGDIYLAGSTASADWVPDGYTPGQKGKLDAFAMKVSSAGSHVWTTRLGGGTNDSGSSIALDSTGRVIVAGSTTSAGWVSGGYDTTYVGKEFATVTDGFVVALSSQGQHVWSTYLGGDSYDEAHGVAVDSSDNIYVAGQTSSSGWISGGWKAESAGGTDGFVVGLSSTGQHRWSTYMGGNSLDIARGIDVSDDGQVNVVGETSQSSGVPNWVSGGFNTIFRGITDGFIVNLTEAGEHQWSAFMGDDEKDYAQGVSVDGQGNILIAGNTGSAHWITNGWDTVYSGTWDGFVLKLDQPATVTGFGEIAEPPIDSLGSVEVTFSELIDVGSFDWSAVTLTRDGSENLINASSGAGLTLTLESGTTYILGGLTSLTDQPGAYTLTLVADGVSDLAGYGLAFDASVSFDIGLTAATAPVLAAGSEGSPGYTATTTPTVEGQAIPGVQVTIYEGESVLGTGVADGAGHYSITLSALTQGAHTIYAVASSGSQTAPASGNTVITVDTTTPSIANMSSYSAPRAIPVGSTGIRFSSVIDLATFTVDDLILTRDGVSVSTSGITVVGSGGDPKTYTIVIPQGLNSQAGVYVLQVVGAGIKNLAGTAVSNNFSTRWTTLAQMVNMSQYPDARTKPVTAPGVRFRNPIAVNSFTWADVTLTRDGGANLATSAFSIVVSPGDPNIYNILIPAGITSVPGVYTLTINGAGIKIASGAYALNGVISTTWTQL